METENFSWSKDVIMAAFSPLQLLLSFLYEVFGGQAEAGESGDMEHPSTEETA